MVSPAKIATDKQAHSLQDLSTAAHVSESAARRGSMRYDEASPDAQAFWRTIEAAQESRPDLMQALVSACLGRGITLQKLSDASSDALTMWSVVHEISEQRAAELSPPGELSSAA